VNVNLYSSYMWFSLPQGNVCFASGTFYNAGRILAPKDIPIISFYGFMDLLQYTQEHEVLSQIVFCGIICHTWEWAFPLKRTVVGSLLRERNRWYKRSGRKLTAFLFLLKSFSLCVSRSLCLFPSTFVISFIIVFFQPGSLGFVFPHHSSLVRRFARILFLGPLCIIHDVFALFVFLTSYFSVRPTLQNVILFLFYSFSYLFNVGSFKYKKWGKLNFHLIEQCRVMYGLQCLQHVLKNFI
jgi:hypothetical protein